MSDTRQPSLFDQLTPDDSLRADLDWLDSLETAPASGKPALGARDAGDAPAEEAETTRLPRIVPPEDAASDPTGVLETVSDGDARPRAGAAVWARRVLIALATGLAILIALAMIGTHSSETRIRESQERLQTSMSRLERATKTASGIRSEATKAGVGDSKELDELSALIESNTKLARSGRQGLSVEETDALAARADKETGRTRRLCETVGRQVRDKPLSDAKATCSAALGKARDAAKGADPSDDASRKALESLKTLIAKADRLDDGTTAGQWKDMAAKLDRARGELSSALEAKRKSDEQAEALRKQQESQRQESEQQPQTPSAPQYQQYQPQYRQQYRGTSGGAQTPSAPSTGGSSQGGSNGGSGGWYVPPAGSGDGLGDTDPSL